MSVVTGNEFGWHKRFIVYAGFSDPDLVGWQMGQYGVEVLDGLTFVHAPVTVNETLHAGIEIFKSAVFHPGESQ